MRGSPVTLRHGTALTSWSITSFSAANITSSLRSIKWSCRGVGSPGGDVALDGKKRHTKTS